MKKFFEEHGGIVIILIVIAVLLVLVGSVKGLDEGTGKVNGSGVAAVVGNTYSNAIDKFKDSFDNIPINSNDDNVDIQNSNIGKLMRDNEFKYYLAISGKNYTFITFFQCDIVEQINDSKNINAQSDTFNGICYEYYQGKLTIDIVNDIGEVSTKSGWYGDFYSSDFDAANMNLAVSDITVTKKAKGYRGLSGFKADDSAPSTIYTNAPNVATMFQRYIDKGLINNKLSLIRI